MTCFALFTILKFTLNAWHAVAGSTVWLSKSTGTGLAGRSPKAKKTRFAVVTRSCACFETSDRALGTTTSARIRKLATCTLLTINFTIVQGCVYFIIQKRVPWAGLAAIAVQRRSVLSISTNLAGSLTFARCIHAEVATITRSLTLVRCVPAKVTKLASVLCRCSQLLKFSSRTIFAHNLSADSVLTSSTCLAGVRYRLGNLLVATRLTIFAHNGGINSVLATFTRLAAICS